MGHVLWLGARAPELVGHRVTVVPDRITDADQLTTLARRLLPIDAVITRSEFCMEAAAITCDRLGVPFTSAAGVANTRDKARARELLAAARLPTVDHARADDVAGALRAARRIGFPVVLKPVSGADSILAFRANNEKEATAAARRILGEIEGLPADLHRQFLRGILVERFLEGRLVSTELGVLNGRFHRFMVSEKLRAQHNICLNVGSLMPAGVSVELAGECFRYAERVCGTLGLDRGIFHIEMMLTSRGPVLVEANSRLMGGTMPALYRSVTGHDIHADLVRIHLGEDFSLEDRPFRCYMTGRKIMPLRDGRVAGAQVKQAQVLGRFQVRGADAVSAARIAGSVLDRLENDLGIRLARERR